MEMLADAVKQTGRGLHIHVAEDSYDVSYGHDLYGQDLIARMAGHGLINARTLIGHGLYLSEGDIEILNSQDGFLVHNARSNMNNNVGYNHKLAKYRNLALGTDGIGADMFEEMKFAYFKHRDAGGSMWPDSFTRFLWNGNILLERNFGAKFGKLEPGYKADLTICAYDSPTPFQAENVGGHLAFGMNASVVDSVMVEGRMVYENRAFPFDVAPIYERARDVAAQLWKRMDSLD